MADDGKVVYRILGDNSEFQKSVGKTQQIASTAAKAIGAAFAAAGAAIIKIAKDSVDLFAEYEQLVGGVETLFKDSADAVQQYAENAYKTAGLSANDYMSTVTSFSASLLQSLGGDTEKAAQYADLAITDMADNANKMGTAMESIQAAYQGFAKQNFTMLDNLKLGYGGTKTEMERLLKDAEAIKAANGEMVTYSIDKYADMVEAIHVVQENLGIAGTTAQEAATTIQGSASMTRAAWQNLLTGIAVAGADVSGLVGQFVESFNTLLKNLTPVIETIVAAMPTLVGGIAEALLDVAPTVLGAVSSVLQQAAQLLIELLPVLVPIIAELAQGIVDAIVTNAPTIMDAGLALLMSFIQLLIDNAPKIITAAVEMVSQLAQFLVDNVDMIIDAAFQLHAALVETLLDPANITKLVEAAVQLVVALVKGIIQAVPQYLAAIDNLINSLLEALRAILTTLIDIGRQWIMNVTQGIRERISNALTAVSDLISQLKQRLLDRLADFRDIGRQILSGLIEGIKSKVSDAIAAVRNAVGSVVDGAKSLLGIRSPSRVFMAIGQNVDEGLAQGIEQKADTPEKRMRSMLAGLVDGVNGLLGNAFNSYSLAGAATSASYSSSFSIGKMAESISVRSDSDIEAIARALYEKIVNTERGRGRYI